MYSVVTKNLKRKLLAAALALPLTAFASEDVLEEVVVTAKYRSTELMRSSGSISVLNQAVLQERAAQHLEDVLSAAPNISWSTGASRSRFVQVRGIGDLEQYAEPKYYPSVGIMLDDLEMGSAASAGMLFDVAQVEVLRGPQGTRFGASAQAGMIKMRTNAPTEDFQAQISGGVGNYGAYNLGAVLSGPLGENLSGRLAVQQNGGDGYIDNDYLGEDDSADFDELTLRTRLRWQPTEFSQYDFSAFVFDSDNGYDAYSLDNNRTTWSDTPGEDSQETYAFTGKAFWELGEERSLQALVTRMDSEPSYSYDADWVSPEYCETYTCSGGVDSAQEIFDRDRDQTTADIRLLGGSDNLSAGDWRYVLGVYANNSTEKLDYAYPSAWYGDYQNGSRYETERYAMYGELEYGISDRWLLSASTRLERFEDDYRDDNGVAHDDDENLWNGELTTEYQLSDETFVYATLALASKPGGVNVSASSQYGFMSPVFQGFMESKLRFDEETLFNRELGIKTRQLDQRLVMRAALFYASRDNAQLENWMYDDAAGLWIGYLDSNSDADSYGAELEASFQLNGSVQLFANLGWLETEVDTITTFDLDQFDFVTKDDRDQSKSPNYQFSTGVRASLGRNLSGTLEFEGRDDSYFGYYHDGKLDSYELVNASLSWNRDRLSVTLWGRNLSDEDYATHGLYFGADPRDDFGAWANDTYLQFGEPRTYGVNMSYDL